MQKLDLPSRVLIYIDFRGMPDCAWTHSWTRKRLPSRDGTPWIVMASAFAAIT
jgi:hypothetical protein